METEAGVSILQLDQLNIDGTDELRVLSPTAGVFYRSSTPSEPEFVSPGDIIDPQRTLCLLEAMKVFQPLTLESCFSGSAALFGSQKYQIVRVVPENGQSVNLGDLLFVIRPAQCED